MNTKNVSGTYMPPLVQNSKLPLICTRHGRNPCTKFGTDQASEGVKNIEQTTHWTITWWIDLDLKINVI